MTKDSFAKRFGFENYEQILKKSTAVIFDHGVNYYITPTSKGWLAWIDQFPEQEIGLFESFEIAQIYLIAAFEEATKRKLPIRLVSEINQTGGLK